jgi:hypothetical protein
LKLNSYLVQNRYGVYYLRLQRNGKEWRRSLRTKNPDLVAAVAYRFGATIHRMAKDIGYIVTLPNGTSVQTDGTQEDHDRALEMVREAQKLQPGAQTVEHVLNAWGVNLTQSTPPTLKAICLRDAVQQYEPHIKGAAKSIKMAKTTLGRLVSALGADFDMAGFNDESVATKWLEPRKKIVAGSTAKSVMPRLAIVYSRGK